MTKDEALRLALEALENSEPNKRRGDDDYREIGWMEHREAITAIKAALEAKDEPMQKPWAVARVDDLERGGRTRALAMMLGLDAPLYATPPAAPVQEPVALDITLEGDEAQALYDQLGDDRENLHPIRMVVGDGHSGHGLYVAQAEYQDEGAVLITSITPPQRNPLTDEEIVLIVAECAASHQHTDIHFARAIEAKLKEKNT